MRSPWIMVCCAIVCVIGSGCVNPYKNSYLSSIEKWPSGEASRLLPRSAAVKLLSSSDMAADVQSMMENGYLLLGRSQFHSTVIDEYSAVKQAESIGASVVLLSKSQVGTVTQSIPVSEWIPPREMTYVERVRTSPATSYERTVTRTVQGEFRTTYVPQSVDYYEFAATFWARSKPPLFGVIVRAMDEPLKELIQSNKGVAVEAVIKGSPAFNANILRNDIITRLDDRTLDGPDDFFDYVVSHAGKAVNVTLMRNGSPRSVPLELNKE